MTGNPNCKVDPRQPWEYRARRQWHQELNFCRDMIRWLLWKRDNPLTIVTARRFLECEIEEWLCRRNELKQMGWGPRWRRERAKGAGA